MEVKVNAEQWKSLTSTDQTKMAEILQTQFQAKIVPDTSIPPVDPKHLTIHKTFGILDDLLGPIKKPACDVAQAAAVAACATLSGSVAIAACVAAAQAAGDACRNG